MVSPIKESDILSILDIEIAESTVISAPKRVTPIENKDMANHKIKVY